MCITFLFTNLNDKKSRYKLVLINNRDEFFARITLKAELRESSEKIRKIHGTDIEAIERGTWLGLSQSKNTIRIGNLLNVAGESRKHGIRGRGSLALDFINDRVNTIEEHNRKVLESGSEYNGFNLLTVELKGGKLKAFNTCNVDQSIQRVPLGYFGVSNSPLSLPYQKVTIGTQRFQDILKQHRTSDKPTLIHHLLNFLKSEEKHLPCQELARRRPHDAPIFSSIHVRHTQAQYGTRNRSVILIDHHHNVDFTEERMVNENPESPVWERQDFRIAGRSAGMLEYLVRKSRLLGRLRAML